MTVTFEPTIAPLAAVTVDLYRDIHKGIRAELFAVTAEAGRTDGNDRVARTALVEHVGRVCELLTRHTEHEDAGVQPALEANLPDIAQVIATVHPQIDARVDAVRAFALDIADAPGLDGRETMRHLYLELASFTGAYLEHQDYEERVVMPALEAAIGMEAVLGVHQAIVGPMPPAELAASLAVMLPAMNVDDRTELLGGIRAGAPAEVFSGVWALATSVLDGRDAAAVAVRLGIAN